MLIDTATSIGSERYQSRQHCNTDMSSVEDLDLDCIFENDDNLSDSSTGGDDGVEIEGEDEGVDHDACFEELMQDLSLIDDPYVDKETEGNSDTDAVTLRKVKEVNKTRYPIRFNVR